MATLITTAFGEPAMDVLASAVQAAKAGDPLAPVLVVVASDRLGVGVRRGLASRGLDGRSGIAGVSPITWRRIAETIAAPSLAIEGRLPVTRPVLVGALHGLLRQEPGVFREVAEHPETARALVRAHEQLRPLEPPVVEEIGATSETARDVVRIHRALEARWAGTHYDEVDLLARAAGLIATSQRTLPPVVVFLPAPPDPSQQGLIRALAATGEVTVIVGISGMAAQDRVAANEWATQLGVPAPSGTPVAEDLPDEDLPAEDLPAAGEQPAWEPTTADAVLVATDADDEAREVVRRVLAALADGVPGHRIAVLYGSREPYARLLAEQLQSAGITLHGRGVRPASERLLGRSLRRLLGLASADFRRDEVMSLLADGSVRWRGRTPRTSAWERLSREAGVVRGEDWDVRLHALAGGLRDRAERERSESEPAEAAGVRADEAAAEAEELAAFVTDLRERLEALAASDSWTACAGHVRALWADVLGSGSAPWLPDEERRVAEVIDRILRSLPSLDSLASPYSLDALRELVETELDADLDRVGRHGVGVHLAPVSDGVGLSLELVFVVGMAEGLFPPRPADDPLLPDAARQRSGAALPTLRERIDRQHHDFLAALASAPAGTAQVPRRILSFPRGDLRRGGLRVPSRWSIPTLTRLSGQPVVATEWESATSPAIQVAASAGAAVLGSRVPSTDQEWRQRARAAGASDPLSTVEARAREMRQARRGRALTRFDGLVGEHPWLAERISGVLSASALETWFRCPHQYMVRQLLGVREVEDPEEIVQISALDSGGLLHGVLDRFVRDSQEAGETPAGGAPWPAASRSRLGALIDEEFADIVTTGRVGLLPLWESGARGLRADLHEFIPRDDKRRAKASLTPLASELAFGLKGQAPVEIGLPGGGALRIRGSIDRVDSGPDGLVVLDYKTGKSKKHAKLEADLPTQQGRFLQLALYAVAARQVLGMPDVPVDVRYWFITRGEKFQLFGYPAEPETVAAALDVVEVAVEGIRRGLFPPRPTADSEGYACSWCDPDGRGERTSVERFRALLGDPLLAGYRAVLDQEVGRVAAAEVSA